MEHWRPLWWAPLLQLGAQIIRKHLSSPYIQCTLILVCEVHLKLHCVCWPSLAFKQADVLRREEQLKPSPVVASISAATALWSTSAAGWSSPCRVDSTTHAPRSSDSASCMPDPYAQPNTGCFVQLHLLTLLCQMHHACFSKSLQYWVLHLAAGQTLSNLTALQTTKVMCCVWQTLQQPCAQAPHSL